MNYVVESSDLEEPSEDTVVLEVDNPALPSPPKPMTGRRKVSRLFGQQVREWKDPPTVPIFDVTDYNNNEVGDISLPVEIFRRFISDDLLDLIVEQSNLYAI